MMVQCVIPVISSQYLEFDGNVPSAPTMTCVQSATIATNITCGIGFSGLTHLEVKGLYAYSVPWLCTSHTTDVGSVFPRADKPSG